MVMMFNNTFNNISVTSISGRPVLLMEETGIPEEIHWPVASHWETLPHNVVSSTDKTDCSDLSEILLKLVLHTVNLTPQIYIINAYYYQ
jgi:hypothetical protein